MNIYELGIHSWVILPVKWCCAVRTAAGCSSFHSVCVPLWGLRPYWIAYVNIKVLYIRRGHGVIFTRLVAAFVICVALRMESVVMN